MLAVPPLGGLTISKKNAVGMNKNELNWLKIALKAKMCMWRKNRCVCVCLCVYFSLLEVFKKQCYV